MPSAYLQSADFATYGLPTSTTTGQVTQASALIDAHLRRPDGLMWAPDANGVPAYMAAKAPSLTLNTSAVVAPGAEISVPLPVPPATLGIQAGDVVVIDRAVSNACEAVVVDGFKGNSITLRAVQFAHAQGATLDFGMAITEQMYVPTERPIVRLSQTPTFRVISGAGRFGYGRRGDAGTSLTQFGGPPLWEVFDPTVGSLDAGTGQFWMPSSVYLAYYSEARLHYVAGFQYANLPSAVKNACAFLINAITQSRIRAGGLKSYAAGDTKMERFASTVFDDDIKSSLAPYTSSGFA